MTLAGDHAVRPLRLGIAGLGFAVDVHLPAFRSIRGIEVVALLGQRPERAEEATGRTGLPVDVNVSTWLDRDLDAVSVAVPPQAVAPVVSAVLQRKLPVLCEKPLGVSSAEAQMLAAQAIGIVTALDFQFADLDCFRSLKTAIDEGVLGRIRHVSVTWLTNSYTHRAGLWSWKSDRGRAGGALTLLGTHLLYLAEWLLGPATELAARLDAQGTAPRRPDDAAAADDLLVLANRHANGAVLAATVSNASPGVSVHRWIVVGDQASAIVENETRDYMAGFSLRILDKSGAVVSSLKEPATEGDGKIPPFHRLAMRFVDAVRTGGTCRPDFADGARVALLVDMIRESAAQRAARDVPAPAQRL